MLRFDTHDKGCFHRAMLLSFVCMKWSGAQIFNRDRIQFNLAFFSIECLSIIMKCESFEFHNLATLPSQCYH